MNQQKLAIIALGHRNAGKSNTWYEFFGRTIRSGVKRFTIDKEEVAALVRNSSFEESGIKIEDYFEAHVRNASFEEYGDDIEDYFDEENLPDMVFCSVQYVEKGITTINWLKEKGYHLYIQWLNPGFHGEPYSDYLGFKEKFEPFGTFTICSGKEKASRVNDIKQFLYRWLIKGEFQKIEAVA
jgi:hypothetical protein